MFPGLKAAFPKVGVIGLFQAYLYWPQQFTSTGLLFSVPRGNAVLGFWGLALTLARVRYNLEPSAVCIFVGGGVEIFSIFSDGEND